MKQNVVRRDGEHKMLKRYFAADNLHVIEAGCGRGWPKDFRSAGMLITGIDLDETAMANRTDLDRAIIGSLTTVDLPADCADIVYSSFVLEHVRNVEKVLDNFRRWVRPGGFIIVRVRNLSMTVRHKARRV